MSRVECGSYFEEKDNGRKRIFLDNKVSIKFGEIGQDYLDHLKSYADKNRKVELDYGEITERNTYSFVTLTVNPSTRIHESTSLKEVRKSLGQLEEFLFSLENVKKDLSQDPEVQKYSMSEKEFDDILYGGSKEIVDERKQYMDSENISAIDNTSIEYSYGASKKKGDSFTG